MLSSMSEDIFLIDKHSKRKKKRDSVLEREGKGEE